MTKPGIEPTISQTQDAIKKYIMLITYPIEWLFNTWFFCGHLKMQFGTYQEKMSEEIGSENLLQAIWVEEVLLSEETLCGSKHVDNISVVRAEAQSPSH